VVRGANPNIEIAMKTLKLELVAGFFEVFERVSWWSYRVSIPFSLLCLILLTDFHKKQVSVQMCLII